MRIDSSLRTAAEAQPNLSRNLFLGAAFASFLLSIALWFSGDRQAGIFVGLWVPSICGAGALVLGEARHE